jgi:hypothetical protein
MKYIIYKLYTIHKLILIKEIENKIFFCLFEKKNNFKMINKLKIKKKLDHFLFKNSLIATF